MSLLVYPMIFSMPVIPFLGPVLPDGVVWIVRLAPALSFPQTTGQIDLPFVTPFSAVTLSVNLAPLFMPLLLSLQILTPLFARRLLSTFFAPVTLLVPFFVPLIGFRPIGSETITMFGGPVFVRLLGPVLVPFSFGIFALIVHDLTAIRMIPLLFEAPRFLGQIILPFFDGDHFVLADEIDSLVRVFPLDEGFVARYQIC